MDIERVIIYSMTKKVVAMISFKKRNLKWIFTFLFDSINPLNCHLLFNQITRFLLNTAKIMKPLLNLITLSNVDKLQRQELKSKHGSEVQNNN